MKRIALIVALTMALCLLSFGQPTEYSTRATSGAPNPAYPISPEYLNLQAPPSIAVQDNVPSVSERSQNIIMSDERSAYSVQADSVQVGSVQVGSRSTSDNPVYSQIVLPPSGFIAPNELYIAYAPLTVTRCNLYANLPLWMNITSRGTIWFYEWYPNGKLYVNYVGSIYYPTWYKRWFFADSPGWHILQYYCNGWSNYAYVYVDGPSGYWVDPDKNPTTSITIITEPPITQQKPSILPPGPSQQKPSILPTGPTQKPSITKPSITQPTTPKPTVTQPPVAKPLINQTTRPLLR